MRSLLASLLFLLSSTHAYAAPLKVVASFSILGDMVKQVGGDNVEVGVLVGPNADTHTFQPSPDDAKMLGKADLIVVNGLGFEGWLGKLVVAAGYTGQIVRATENINTLALDTTRNQDPHAWQDLANGKIYVANIRDALIKADADNESTYRLNAEKYMNLIDQTDAWGRAEISRVPVPKRRVISSHNAFAYFSKAYGVAFIAAQGNTEESSPSAASLAALIDQIKARSVHVVFMENITDPRLIMQLEKDAGAYIGGTLFSDALSVSGGPADSYLAMYRNNITTLVAGMLHNPPAP